MTDTPPAASTESLSLLQLWSDSFSQVLGQITGSPVTCKVHTAAPASSVAAESDQLVLITFSGGLRGEMSLRLAAPVVVQLAQIFTSEPAAPEVELTGDHREAVIELLRQIAGIVTTSAKPRWGEIQLLVEQAAATPSWASAGTCWLQAGEDGPSAVVLEFGLSAALLAELKTEKAAPARVETPAAAPKPGADATQGGGTLDLLMDVQLAMTLRFGSTRLLLREILDLNPGSVIELDRKIQEPVDLLLDGKMVARGEVVVIEGNYGLRVTEVSGMEAK